MSYYIKMQQIIKKIQKAKEPFSTDETQPAPKGLVVASGMFIFFLVLWVILGFSAFIMSLVCFGKSGSPTEHLLGLFLAVFFGPFYWIYYIVAKSYCIKW